MRYSVAVAALALLSIVPARAHAQPAALAGQWTLDKNASQFPKEIGFGINWATTGTTDAPGGRGGSQAGSPGRNIAAPRESSEDALRLRLMTNEVRNPPARLTIAASADAVTITTDEGTARTFHPTGRQEVVGRLQGDVTVLATSRLEGDRLIVLYEVEENRQLRYSYAATTEPRQLTVDVQFLERGKGDSVRRVYASQAPPAAAAAPAAAAPSATPAPTTSGSAAAPGMPASAAAPASQSAASKADLRPGAELKGLSRLAIVVEDLGSQATACGLTKDAIEKAVTKSVADAGLQIVRNTDEDTYLYVNVMAASTGGACVTRYDATLYTHATAALPHTVSPVLVQVELLRKGGIAGGAPAANGQAVIKGLTDFVNGFTTRIREAGR